jgi:hypothetical protein
MMRNVGTVDRLLRAALGLVLLWLALFSGIPAVSAGWVQVLLSVVGAVMLVVAAVRICPVYTIFGIRTCRAT